MKKEIDRVIRLRSFPCCISMISHQDLLFRNKFIFFLSSMWLRV